MARLIQLTPSKTYATRENAQKAVERRVPADKLMDQTYFIAVHTDGRFFPVFIGERAMRDGLHFHFNIVG
jgi:hypothetical protein